MPVEIAGSPTVAAGREAAVRESPQHFEITDRELVPRQRVTVAGAREEHRGGSQRVFLDGPRA